MNGLIKHLILGYLTPMDIGNCLTVELIGAETLAGRDKLFWLKWAVANKAYLDEMFKLCTVAITILPKDDNMFLVGK